MGILMFRHCDVKMTSYTEIFMNLNSEHKIALCGKFKLDHVIVLKIIQVSLFFHPKK